MSYVPLEDKTVICRKEHKCIWCGEKILKGEKSQVLKGVYENSFQNDHWHIECYVASSDYNWDDYDGEFEPYECKRGSLEQRI